MFSGTSLYFLSNYWGTIRLRTNLESKMIQKKERHIYGKIPSRNEKYYIISTDKMNLNKLEKKKILLKYSLFNVFYLRLVPFSDSFNWFRR